MSYRAVMLVLHHPNDILDFLCTPIFFFLSFFLFFFSCSTVAWTRPIPWGTPPAQVNSSARPYVEKNPLQNKAGGVAQGVGPNFKSQYHQKKLLQDFFIKGSFICSIGTKCLLWALLDSRYDCGKQNKKVKKQNFLPLQSWNLTKRDNKEK
jgi:hypothetical protein